MLLDRKRFGLILRVFAPKAELVPNYVAQVKKAIDIAMSVSIGGKQLFSQTDVLVSSDKRFTDVDCGETAPALRETLKECAYLKVREVNYGDIFCGLLNYGITIQLRNRIDYSCILSIQVASYLNNETVLAIIAAIEAGAKVVGVALEELQDSILQGRIANTFAVWDNIELMSVGGFDLRARKPYKDDLLAPRLRGWSQQREQDTGSGEVYYHQAGVEEILPLIRLVELHGPCIAPILPRGDKYKWVAPDSVSDREGFERHMEKMGTKLGRQSTHAASLNTDLSFLKGGVMPLYRRF